MSKESIFFRENKWLYHFTRFDVAKIIVSTNRLKYSMLSGTNDVCEHARCIYNLYSLQQTENICEDIKCEIYNYRQISLSEDKHVFGRKAFDLQQMWGLYADKGFGVCLVFDKTEFLESLGDCCYHGEVSYNVELTPDIYTEIENSKDIASYIKDNAKTLFFQKRKEWEHEQEYRVVSIFSDQDCEKYHDFENSLKYVILYNSRTIKSSDSILNSVEYKSLKHHLSADVKILFYSSFLNEQSLLCYDENQNFETFWNSSENYGEISDVP